MPQLENTARVDASIAGDEVYDISTASVEIPGIAINKSANMTVWHGDELQYTITVFNMDTITVEDIVLKDTIQPSLAKLKTDSVKLDNNPVTEGPAGFEYNTVTGELTVYAIPDMEAAGSHVVTFLVTKVQQ